MSTRDLAIKISRISRLFVSRITDPVVAREAIKENPWFTEEDIRSSANAIAGDMLDKDKLIAWVDGCGLGDRPLNVAVVMAGNIPMVGFADMLAVVVSGNRCLYKLSSKDSVLMEVAASLIRECVGEGMVQPLSSYSGDVDAVIATGSDNSGRYFRYQYDGIPMVVRSSRYSVAVIDETEEEDLLIALWDDIFRYQGRGCRNVSTLLLPKGYDVAALVNLWKREGLKVVSSEYLGSYTQNRALLAMQGVDFVDGGYFTMRSDVGSLQPLSEIAIVYYEDIEEVFNYLSVNDDKIQCVVSDSLTHPRGVEFGMAQRPALSDWADGVDIFKFLNSLY